MYFIWYCFLMIKTVFIKCNLRHLGTTWNKNDLKHMLVKLLYNLKKWHVREVAVTKVNNCTKIVHENV